MPGSRDSREVAVEGRAAIEEEGEEEKEESGEAERRGLHFSCFDACSTKLYRILIQVNGALFPG